MQIKMIRLKSHPLEWQIKQKNTPKTDNANG